MIWVSSGYPFTMNPHEVGAHGRLQYRNGTVDLKNLVEEQVMSRRGRLLVAGEFAPLHYGVLLIKQKSRQLLKFETALRSWCVAMSTKGLYSKNWSFSQVDRSGKVAARKQSQMCDVCI